MRSRPFLLAALGTVHLKGEEYISKTGLRVFSRAPPPIMINKQRCVRVQDEIRTRRF